jgi:hypothetical protein
LKAFKLNIKVIIQIDALIQRGATGSPSELSGKLNLTERTVYNYIKFMKEELNAPILFSRGMNSYKYIEIGGFGFKWCNE